MDHLFATLHFLHSPLLYPLCRPTSRTPSRDLPQRPSEDMQACVSLLAHHVVRVQEQGSVLSPWSLMACVLLQSPVSTLVQEGLAWGTLTQRTLWLRGHALAFGARLNWPGGWVGGWVDVGAQDTGMDGW